MTNLNTTKQEKFSSSATFTGLFANISVGWKLTLMVFVLSLGVAAITVSAYVGLQDLRYQLSNIYDFMLVPIVAINQADTALANAQYDILQAHSEDITDAERTQFVSNIVPSNQLASDVAARYDTEWVTTLSPEFTQALREGGKLALQEQEVAALTEFHTAFDAYQTTLDKYLASVKAGKPNVVLATETIGKLQVARTNLEKLIEINNQYADFSNGLALNAYQRAITTSGIVLVLSIALGFLISYLVASSITRRLGELTKSAAALQEGNFNQTVNVTGNDEVGRLGTAFRNMAKQLNDVFSTLEQRIADRTKALTTSAEVTSRLAVVTDTRQLASEVVEQVQSAFNYYHAHIYYLDEATGDLIMAGGTGEAGATMLANKHKVQKGRGLVGRAANTNAPILVPDVSKAEGWLPNPLLPDTKSELSVPISSGNRVLGVLDVQQNTVNSLSEDDVNLLQSLAGQIAISLQNARTLEETRAKAEFETLANTIGQKIQNATTVDETLRTAIRELGTALGASLVKANISAQKDGSNN